MVSRNNILLIGAAVLALGIGGFSLLGNKKGGAIVQTVFGATDPPPPPPPPESQQLQGLRSILASAQGVLKTTFKAPKIPRGLCTGGKCFPCRGPNCLGIFQARGTLSSFDPFTGNRLAIGGSSKFQQITGSNFALNQAKITQGNIIKSDLSAFIANITNQIGLLEKPNIVTL